jgi:hypothetical protein
MPGALGSTCLKTEYLSDEAINGTILYNIIIIFENSKRTHYLNNIFTVSP